jgi:hypothetical protein
MHAFRNVNAVIPGLDPGIHAFLIWSKNVDGRVKPAMTEWVN